MNRNLRPRKQGTVQERAERKKRLYNELAAMDINSAPLSPDSPDFQDNIEDALDIDPRVEQGDRFQEIISRNGVAEAELGEGFTARFVTPTHQQMPIMSLLGTFRYLPPEQAG